MSDKRYRPCGADTCCYTDDKAKFEQLEKHNAVLREALVEERDFLLAEAKELDSDDPDPIRDALYGRAGNLDAALKVAGSDCCGNPAQCWEPCGDLGKSEEHVQVADITLPNTDQVVEVLSAIKVKAGFNSTAANKEIVRLVDDCLATTQPSEKDPAWMEELPGMWDKSDLIGGAEDNPLPSEVLTKLQTENKALREALEKIARYEVRAHIQKPNQCAHDRYGFEECEDCLCEFAEQALKERGGKKEAEKETS